MNALTIITIIIILSAAVIGYIKGLVRCVFGVLFSVITFLLAYLISPFIYGLVTSYTGGEKSKWGLSVIILWSFFGFSALFLGQRYIINEKGEINKDIFLENLIERSSNDNIFNEYENSYEDKIKQNNDIYGLSKESKELDNNENKIAKNEDDEIKSYFRGKSYLIQSIYGGMSHK